MAGDLLVDLRRRCGGDHLHLGFKFDDIFDFRDMYGLLTTNPSPREGADSLPG